MPRYYWNTFHALSSFFYFSLIIITIPLAFDVGGEDCGIVSFAFCVAFFVLCIVWLTCGRQAFTGTLSVFYLVLSTLRHSFKNTKFRFLSSSLYHLQQIIIPSLLIFHLSIFSLPTSTLSSDAPINKNTSSYANLISDQSQHDSIRLWLTVLEPWKWFLKNATPLFTTMEGFCTLLVLQTAGRLSSWLVRTKSDSWMIVQLLASSCTISTSLYFLYRIYTFPVTISLVSATLIGVVLTIAIFVGLYGIVSGKGNMVESSLLFTYIVYCLYFTFTDFQSSISASTLLYFFSSSTRTDLPPLPPVIIDGYTEFVSTLAALVPASFKTVFYFLQGAVSTVTPSVIVSLSYRLAVFFAATRIIPAVHEAGYSRINDTLDEEEADSAKSRLDAHATDELNQDDREYEESAIVDDDEDTSVSREKSAHMEKYLNSIATTSEEANATVTSATALAHPADSKTVGIQSIIYSVAPCILIAVYTHLLIQHLNLFNTINSTTSQAIPTTSTFASSFATTTTFTSPSSNSSPYAHSYQPFAQANSTMTESTNATLSAVWTWTQGWINPRDSWQFWGWVNMFSTLFFYSLELIYGKEHNREEIIEQHWKTD